MLEGWTFLTFQPSRAARRQARAAYWLCTAAYRAATANPHAASASQLCHSRGQPQSTASARPVSLARDIVCDLRCASLAARAWAQAMAEATRHADKCPRRPE